MDGWTDGLTDGQMSKWMMEEVEGGLAKEFRCLRFSSVAVIKCPDKSHLKEKGVILAHNSSPSHREAKAAGA